MAKSKKRKKKKKRGQQGSGGTMSSLRGGMKNLVGQGPKKKESTASKLLTYVLLAAAIGLLIYRFTR